MPRKKKSPVKKSPTPTPSTPVVSDVPRDDVDLLGCDLSLVCLSDPTSELFEEVISKLGIPFVCPTRQFYATLRSRLPEKFKPYTLSDKDVRQLFATVESLMDKNFEMSVNVVAVNQFRRHVRSQDDLVLLCEQMLRTYAPGYFVQSLHMSITRGLVVLGGLRHPTDYTAAIARFGPVPMVSVDGYVWDDRATVLAPEDVEAFETFLTTQCLPRAA